MRSFPALLLGLATASLAACSESPQEPDTPDPSLDAVAQAVADATLADLSLMAAGVPGMFPATGAGAAPERGRNATFRDGDGNAMDAYDALLTASIEWSDARSRQVTRGSMTGEMSHTREMVVSGLLGEETERTHDGSGTDTHSRLKVDDVNGDRSYSMSSSVTIDAVVHAVDRQGQPWPLSGTITRIVEVDVVNGPQGDDSRQRTAVLTFDGTQFATLVVDGETYEVDLAARSGQKPTRRRGGSGR